MRLQETRGEEPRVLVRRAAWAALEPARGLPQSAQRCAASGRMQ